MSVPAPDKPRVDKNPSVQLDPSQLATFDRDKLFPAAVARAQGLDPDALVVLEIPGGSLYNSLLHYAANFAVDLDTPLPDAVSSVTSSSSSETAPPVYKGINGVSVPRREGPGSISSLWNAPDDRIDRYGRLDSDSDSDSDSAFDANSADSGTDTASAAGTDPDLKGPNDESDDPPASLNTLRRTSEPHIYRFQLGLGFAKLPLGSKVIYLHHWGYGLPIPDAFSTQLYRSLTLAGEDAQDLKELCSVALKWRADREQANTRARPGRFTLFRFKTTESGSGDWVNQGYKRARPARSVILPDGQLASIVKDIKDFVAKDTKAWYENHGLPHRRSYLFHGPPGCGKTSTIRMIAGMFRFNACFLSLTAGNFSNQVLQDALANLPRRALLVLEDVDVLFNEDRKSETGTALTFSGMLNALDGLVSVDGIVTIFTTNHIEKLDAALIRGGRVDRRFEFVHPNSKQMCDLFLSFYEGASRELAQRFADSVLSRPEQEARSIATLQQHFIFTRKRTAEECVDHIPQFFAEFYPKGGQTRNHLYI